MVLIKPKLGQRANVQTDRPVESFMLAVMAVEEEFQQSAEAKLGRWKEDDAF